jgi:hypothetical protein
MPHIGGSLAQGDTIGLFPVGVEETEVDACRFLRK